MYSPASPNTRSIGSPTYYRGVSLLQKKCPLKFTSGHLSCHADVVTPNAYKMSPTLSLLRRSSVSATAFWWSRSNMFIQANTSKDECNRDVTTVKALLSFAQEYRLAKLGIEDVASDELLVICTERVKCGDKPIAVSPADPTCKTRVVGMNIVHCQSSVPDVCWKVLRKPLHSD